MDLAQVRAVGCIIHMPVSNKTRAGLLLAASIGHCQVRVVLKETCAQAMLGNKYTPPAVGVFILPNGKQNRHLSHQQDKLQQQRLLQNLASKRLHCTMLKWDGCQQVAGRRHTSPAASAEGGRRAARTRIRHGGAGAVGAPGAEAPAAGAGAGATASASARRRTSPRTLLRRTLECRLRFHPSLATTVTRCTSSACHKTPLVYKLLAEVNACRCRAPYCLI